MESGPYAAEGVQWSLDTLSSEAVPADIEVTLFMNGGDVFGLAGCNSYFGSYQIAAQSLTFPDPFGTTQMSCQGPAQDIESAYLPLLQTTAGWSVDQGVLSLTDAAGAVTLTYSEPPVTITATDIDALASELTSLQAQIDLAKEEITTLSASFDSVNVTRLRNRIGANEEAITRIDATIERLRTRIRANEQAVTRIDETIGRLRERIRALEESDASQDQRIANQGQRSPPWRTRSSYRRRLRSRQLPQATWMPPSDLPAAASSPQLHWSWHRGCNAPEMSPRCPGMTTMRCGRYGSGAAASPAR